MTPREAAEIEAKKKNQLSLGLDNFSEAKESFIAP